MIYLFYGESLPEPYCIDMRRKTALKEVNTKGLNYTSVKGRFDSDISALCRTMPMLENKRGVVLEIESLKDIDNRDFEDYVKKPAPFTELVIICNSVDKRLKMYKKLQNGLDDGVSCVLCDKKTVTKNKLVEVINYELKKQDAKIAPEAMEEFLSRINYAENKDMNLLTATGYLKTLMAISEEITKPMVEKYVPAFKVADAFLLTGLLIRGDIKGLQAQVNMVSPKEAVRILCLILRSFRIAWKRKYFDNVSADGTEALQKYDAETLKKCIGIINRVVSAIKSGYIPQDIALKVACSELAACMG